MHTHIAVLGLTLLALASPAAAQGRQGGQGQRGESGQGVVGGVGTPAATTPPAAPAPRNSAGRVVLSPSLSTTEKGLWLPVFGILDPIAPAAKVPFQPWAKALFDDRQKHELEPHARCKPSGVARQFLTPYGVEFVEMSDLQRLFIFDVGGPHTFRTVFMDGRTHPADATPSPYGHSIGWWDGDTLVIDTVGFSEAFWLDRRGLPHTSALHTIERFTRTNALAVRYEVTVDDAGAYTDRWNAQFNLRLERDTELFEYVCQQANYANELMVGDDRGAAGGTNAIVP